MKVLAIETSCDETSASVVENGRKTLSNVISSQIAIHKKYSGVVPELASRAHLENINCVIDECFNLAGIRKNEIADKIGLIVYTYGPGLAGSLLVGQVAAQTLSFVYGLPLIGVNHLEGHLYAALLENKKLKPPYLSLIVSGGHTELVVVSGYGKYNVLGGTRDDAAGEAFDKVAKLLGLDYPGGPVIDKLAKKGDPEKIKFPRPYMWPTWEFSFSGLKTAVVNHVNMARLKCQKLKVEDICAGFQASVVDTLVEKTIKAAQQTKMKTIVLGGGVAANSKLREVFLKRVKKEKMEVFIPSLSLCTDNAAMIACAGYYKSQISNLKSQIMNCKIEPGLKLESWAK